MLNISLHLGAANARILPAADAAGMAGEICPLLGNVIGASVIGKEKPGEGKIAGFREERRRVQLWGLFGTSPATIPPTNLI